MIKACVSKSAFVTILFVSFVSLSSQGLTQVPPEELSRSQERGRKIYLKGESIGGEISAVLGSREGEFSAQLFPCANCHGLRGTGSSEGGLRPPSINWNALFSPNRSALTGQIRGPYDEESLRRAITAGVDPGGRKLHPGMPRYNLAASQAADLIAYLKILGDLVDTDPGLSADTIKIGAALPMTGPTAGVGEDIKRTLTAYFAQVNSQGGIYGRSLELVIDDSKADPAETAKATRRLVEGDEVFALVGSFEPGGNRGNDGFLQNNEVPLIGPVAFSPRSTSTRNRQTFYLLPSFFDRPARSSILQSATKFRSKARHAKARGGLFEGWIRSRRAGRTQNTSRSLWVRTISRTSFFGWTDCRQRPRFIVVGCASGLSVLLR